MSCRISRRRSSHLLAEFQDVPDFSLARPERQRASLPADYGDLMKRGVKIMERWIQREKLVWGETRV
tara:strand:- start:74 stop:274 length:201 start_codon:yes stop_codon:yes gene_type:complete